jgi:hypothetical protein
MHGSKSNRLRGFMIRALGKHDRRAISKTSIEAWRWEIKAVEPGEHYLYLEIFTIIKLEGQVISNFQNCPLIARSLIRLNISGKRYGNNGLKTKCF